MIPKKIGVEIDAKRNVLVVNTMPYHTVQSDQTASSSWPPVLPLLLMRHHRPNRSSSRPTLSPQEPLSSSI
jgi:hypothetical protein